MALHGKIKINGIELGSWVAVRIEGDDQSDSDNLYSWELRIRHPVRGPEQAAGHLTHRYGDASLALTVKVLSEAQRMLEQRQEDLVKSKSV